MHVYRLYHIYKLAGNVYLLDSLDVWLEEAGET